MHFFYFSYTFQVEVWITLFTRLFPTYCQNYKEMPIHASYVYAHIIHDYMDISYGT